MTCQTVLDIGALALIATRAALFTAPPPPMATLPAGHVAVTVFVAALLESLSGPTTVW